MSVLMEWFIISTFSCHTYDDVCVALLQPWWTFLKMYLNTGEHSEQIGKLVHRTHEEENLYIYIYYKQILCWWTNAMSFRAISKSAEVFNMAEKS